MDSATTHAAARLADACARALGSKPVSIILHGSLAAGGFVPSRSDIDLLVLVSHSLLDSEFETLVSAVQSADIGRATSVDLLVMDVSESKAPTREPAYQLLVEWHPSASAAASVEVRKSDADLVTELSMARESGRALYGADPDQVIGLVPREWIEARGAYWLDRWLNLANDTENAAFMVLTACRMWRYAVEGVHSSKSDAAAWALSRDPSLIGVTHALRQRSGDAAQPVPPDEVLAVLNAARI